MELEKNRLAQMACVICSVIPTYYHKLINPQVIRKLKAEGNIALTFDDGPDIRYTPKLLDLLKRHQIKATFFVVASKAAMNPSLVNRMLEEGHEVGFHSYEHGNGLTKWYRYMQMDVSFCDAIAKKYDWKIRYYRPPWGHSNPFTAHFARKHHYQIAMWNVMAQDWKAHTSAVEIAQKLLKRVKSKSVICLHDAGGAPDAPERTIKALEKVLPILKQQGYRFVGMDG